GISVYPPLSASSNDTGVYASPSPGGPGGLVDDRTVHSAVGTSAPAGENNQRYETLTLGGGARPEDGGGPPPPNSIPSPSPSDEADDSLGPKYVIGVAGRGGWKSIPEMSAFPIVARKSFRAESHAPMASNLLSPCRRFRSFFTPGRHATRLRPPPEPRCDLAREVGDVPELVAGDVTPEDEDEQDEGRVDRVEEVEDVERVHLPGVRGPDFRMLFFGCRDAGGQKRASESESKISGGRRTGVYCDGCIESIECFLKLLNWAIFVFASSNAARRRGRGALRVESCAVPPSPFNARGPEERQWQRPALIWSRNWDPSLVYPARFGPFRPAGGAVPEYRRTAKRASILSHQPQPAFDTTKSCLKASRRRKGLGVTE
ncbi:hypothetical protein THAOC_06095, partial [Thalassiosira oceanica]